MIYASRFILLVLAGFTFFTLNANAAVSFNKIGSGNCFYEPNMDHTCFFTRKATLYGLTGTITQYFRVVLNRANDLRVIDHQERSGEFKAADGTLILWKDTIRSDKLPPYPANRFDFQKYEGSGYIVFYPPGQSKEKREGTQKNYTVVLTIEPQFKLRDWTWLQTDVRTFEKDGDSSIVDKNEYYFLGNVGGDFPSAEQAIVSFFDLAALESKK